MFIEIISILNLQNALKLSEQLVVKSNGQDRNRNFQFEF